MHGLVLFLAWWTTRHGSARHGAARTEECYSADFCNVFGGSLQ